MSDYRLKRIIQVDGTLEVVTGLRIGGSQETMEISGLDNPIIRNPANAEPFIPGSSLKGRMRSLAEWYFGELPDQGDVTRPRSGSKTGRVFGMPARAVGAHSSDVERRTFGRGPTRLIVRDAHLTEEWREKMKLGRPVTEVKSENSINRLTAMAIPRPMERVLPGVQFSVEMLYRVFDVEGDEGAEDERNFDEVFLVALALVQADALGGGSSRGNGKIRFALRRFGEPLEIPTLGSVGAARDIA
jgi:CRISPR-associated protein Csm3